MTSTKKISSLFIGAGGIFLFLLGIFLLGYSGYMIFSQTESQKISEILPDEDVEFVVFYTPSKATEESAEDSESLFFQSLFPELLTGEKDAVFALYISEESQQKEVIRIQEFQEGDEKKTLPSQYCEVVYEYEFCARISDKSRVMEVVDRIKNGASSLAQNDHFMSFQNAIHTNSIAASEFFFFGKTAFAQNIIQEKGGPLLGADLRASLFDIFSLFPDHSPYMFGGIEEGSFSLFFSKPTGEMFFTPVLSEYDISEHFIHSSVDRYLLVKRPKALWERVFSKTDALSQSLSFFTQAALQKSFSTFFLGVSQQGEVSLDFHRDIFPLFEGDVLWAENTNGSAILYSLPKKSITAQVFTKFSDATEQIAQWSVPIQVGHTLKDGTTVYEVFPNTEHISTQKDEDENGKKILFRNTQAQKTLGVVQRDTFLMLSNESRFLDHFWDLKGGLSPFVFPSTESAEVFFSFGFQARETEDVPVIFIEASGKEFSEYFEFSGTAEWNYEYFRVRNEESERYEEFSIEEENLEDLEELAGDNTEEQNTEKQDEENTPKKQLHL